MFTSKKWLLWHLIYLNSDQSLHQVAIVLKKEGLSTNYFINLFSTVVLPQVISYLTTSSVECNRFLQPRRITLLKWWHLLCLGFRSPDNIHLLTFLTYHKGILRTRVQITKLVSLPSTTFISPSMCLFWGKKCRRKGKTLFCVPQTGFDQNCDKQGDHPYNIQWRFLTLTLETRQGEANQSECNTAAIVREAGDINYCFIDG